MKEFWPPGGGGARVPGAPLRSANANPNPFLHQPERPLDQDALTPNAGRGVHTSLVHEGEPPHWMNTLGPAYNDFGYNEQLTAMLKSSVTPSTHLKQASFCCVLLLV